MKKARASYDEITEQMEGAQEAFRSTWNESKYAPRTSSSLLVPSLTPFPPPLPFAGTQASTLRGSRRTRSL